MRSAASAPNRSATSAPERERDGRRDGGQDPDDADVGQAEVQAVDVDEREERRRGDQPAAVEALGERDPRQERAGRAGRGWTRGPRTNAAARRRPPGARGSRSRRRHRRCRRSRPPARRRCRSARTPPANAARAPAAARPMPRTPTTRPRSRAGYIAPHRRRWNGPPNEMLSQNTIATATMTGARRHEEEDEERGGAEPADQRRAGRCPRPEPAGERPEQVRHERRGGEGRQPDRGEAAAPRDGRQDRADRAIVTPIPTADERRSRARLRPTARRDARR